MRRVSLTWTVLMVEEPRSALVVLNGISIITTIIIPRLTSKPTMPLPLFGYFAKFMLTT